MTAYKPAGYPDISAYMIVEDAEASLGFIENVFGGTRLRCYPNGDCKLQHAEIRVGEAVLMIADGIEGWPAIPAHLHCYVPDVDAVYAKALASGATAVQEPIQKDDADKRGGFRDPGGITWWVATMIDPA